MLYEVTFRCGHTRMVNLTGQNDARQRKLLRYKNFVICPDCQGSAYSTSHMRPVSSVWGESEWARTRY